MGKAFIKFIIAAILLSSALIPYSVKASEVTPQNEIYHLGSRIVPGPLPPRMDVTPELAEEFDIEYGQAGGQALLLDFARPMVCDGQILPLAVFFHGGWWMRGSKSEKWEDRYTRRMLYQLGFAVASVEYRFAPGTRLPGQIYDAITAIRFLKSNHKRFGIDPGRIAVWGFSAGGHLVSCLGTMDESFGDGVDYEKNIPFRPLAVVDWAGVVDLSHIWEKVKEEQLNTPHQNLTIVLGCDPLTGCPEKARDMSPTFHATPDDPPILIMHSDMDDIVDISQADTFAKALYESGNAGGFIRPRARDHFFAKVLDWSKLVIPTFPDIIKATVAHLARSLEPALNSDLNMDGRVDDLDWEILNQKMGQTGFGKDGTAGPMDWNPLADINFDGRVDYKDAYAFRGANKKPIETEFFFVHHDKTSEGDCTLNLEIENNGPLDLENINCQIQLDDGYTFSTESSTNDKSMLIVIGTLKSKERKVYQLKLGTCQTGQSENQKHNPKARIQITSDDINIAKGTACLPAPRIEISSIGLRKRGEVQDYNIRIQNTEHTHLTDVSLVLWSPDVTDITNCSRNIIRQGNHYVVGIGKISPGQIITMNLSSRSYDETKPIRFITRLVSKTSNLIETGCILFTQTNTKAF
ncbi:MAG TPA: alpha/beta hydrolase fold domain-containing protein [Caldisericia bacterium]|nr:alpha/beta hydrolase fold domain-containing protein [Caldisericia bacterium]HPF49533.1 alpha/beta hydrolase fold domain-containing protein [Caldisericia bacterium]HPI84173.1 alpha/beta hydrolase fold domain-containing protein [Caldisericia bacterium]HPQ93532.1 alpha/beta hydrolase fold domain-containing protein [Caldisericia bacterium]HRV75462.1 alpha/beta hydrolase fold domain-containing protein [Caldisericia bacterium]